MKNHKTFILNKIKLYGFAAKFLSASIIASIIPIATAPISARIFLAKDYGTLGLYMAANSIINIIAFSHYQHAILLAKDNETAKQAIWFILFITTTVATISGLLMLCVYSQSFFFDDYGIGMWFFLLPASVILSGISASLYLWANRNKDYMILSGNRILQAVITVCIQIGLGLIINNETGLMLGYFTGQLVGAVLLIRRYTGNKQNNIGLPVFSSFKEIAISYKGLVLYSMPSEFINSLINQAPVFLLQKFGGLNYVGNYNFAQRLVSLPQTLISSSIAEMFREKAVNQFNLTGNCRPIFIKTLKLLILLAILPAVFFFFYAPHIFEFIFGKQWVSAGQMASILSILFFFKFIASPLTYVYNIAKKFKEDFLMHIIMLFLILVSFQLGWHLFNDINKSIFVFSISYSFMYVLYAYRSYVLSKK